MPQFKDPRDLGSARHIAAQLKSAQSKSEQTESSASPIAFPLLLLIGILDSGPRMGFLAFLPFVLKAKGGGPRSSAWP